MMIDFSTVQVAPATTGICYNVRHEVASASGAQNRSSGDVDDDVARVSVRGLSTPSALLVTAGL